VRAQFGHCAACWQAAERDLAFDPAHPCSIMYAHDDNMLATSMSRTHQDSYMKKPLPEITFANLKTLQKKS